jgi:hypothetical protein
VRDGGEVMGVLRIGNCLISEVVLSSPLGVEFVISFSLPNLLFIYTLLLTLLCLHV